jgi:hypothetical protein
MRGVLSKIICLLMVLIQLKTALLKKPDLINIQDMFVQTNLLTKSLV